MPAQSPPPQPVSVETAPAPVESGGAAATKELPAQPPAEPQPAAAKERRSLLGSIYSAISSGGGVSLPDLFGGNAPPAEDAERRQP
jgi:hypothetical protein